MQITTESNRDPFYEWLDHEEIRELVNQANDLEPGERLVLLKGLVPGLVDALGPAGFDEFLDELRTKGRRYEEARTHPGEGSAQRRAPGEVIGGPTPEGHVHTREHRDVNRPGGREAERARERELWDERARTGKEPR
jgi:hypothetical protein